MKLVNFHLFYRVNETNHITSTTSKNSRKNLTYQPFCISDFSLTLYLRKDEFFQIVSTKVIVIQNIMRAYDIKKNILKKKKKEFNIINKLLVITFILQSNILDYLNTNKLLPLQPDQHIVHYIKAGINTVSITSLNININNFTCYCIIPCMRFI
jgi:hypothetical protein